MLLYAYRVANEWGRVATYPCPDCEVKEKLFLRNRDKFPIPPFPPEMNEEDARCFNFCTYNLVLHLLTPIEISYLYRIKRIDEEIYKSEMRKRGYEVEKGILVKV